MTNRNIGTRRVSGQQLDILWEYLNSHRDIAVAYNRSLQAKEYASRKWREIAEILNAQGEGAHKDWKGWSKYWVDYKAKLKKRAAALRSSQRRTGGGPSSEQPLTEIEKKFLQILGEDFGQGLTGVRVEPFPEPCGSAGTEGESPAVQIHILSDLILNPEDSPASESILHANVQILDPVQVLDPAQSLDPVQEEPLPATDPPSPSRTPLPARPAPLSAAGHSPRRRRRRREMPLSHEAARRALVQSSERRAEAAVRSSLALEGIGHSLVDMKQDLKEIRNTLQRMERSTNDGVPRAAE